MKKTIMTLLLTAALVQSVKIESVSNVTIPGSVWVGENPGLSDVDLATITNQMGNGLELVTYSTYKTVGGDLFEESLTTSNTGSYIKDGKYFSSADAEGVPYICFIGTRILTTDQANAISGYKDTQQYVHVSYNGGEYVYTTSGTSYRSVGMASLNAPYFIPTTYAWGNDAFFQILIPSE